jgi:hypothetical protein
VNIDTRCAIGVISAKRDCVIEDPAIAKLLGLYATLDRSGRATELAKVSKQLLERRYRGVTKPGEAVALTQLSSGKGSLPTGYAATVRWYPGAKSLRTVVHVRNPYYRLGSLDRLKSRVSLRLNVCASGGSEDTGFYINPTGDGKASVYIHGIGAPMVSAGKWKSFEGGYVVDVEVPYDRIPGCNKAWKQMAVTASVRALGPDCQWDNVTPCCSPEAPPSTATYRLLTRK